MRLVRVVQISLCVVTLTAECTRKNSGVWARAAGVLTLHPGVDDRVAPHALWAIFLMGFMSDGIPPNRSTRPSLPIRLSGYLALLYW